MWVLARLYFAFFRASIIRSRSKLVAQEVPLPSRPDGDSLSFASLTAAILRRTSSCLARSISHCIHLLFALFAPTSTSRWVALFIIRVSDCLTVVASVLSIAMSGPRLSKSKSKSGFASQACNNLLCAGDDPSRWASAEVILVAGRDSPEGFVLLAVRKQSRQ